MNSIKATYERITERLDEIRHDLDLLTCTAEDNDTDVFLLDQEFKSFVYELKEFARCHYGIGSKKWKKKVKTGRVTENCPEP